ncbi:excalibur calcium-binding domain-containing protein [Leucobacter japonicus]|uniref:excalibur calcium-binding domain-containing protein n=1 Tax=Leucobacter japonicus TaxID=1461259 RepID=UPI001F4CDCBF|nr:excalibur calcium-binding domain-containing protein [Leucobacter japonicus]
MTEAHAYAEVFVRVATREAEAVNAMTQWIPGSGSPQAAAPAPARAKRSKWVSVGVPVISSLLAFGLGTGVGAGGSDAQHTQLVASEQSLTSELEQANQEIRVADDALDAAEEAATTAEQAAEQARTDLETQKQQVLSLQAQVDTHVTEVGDLNASNQALAAQVAELQSASAPAQFVDSGASTGVPQSTSAYYENCDAVRAAGAAPLYVDSPGYSRKLDRDGDGIACE